MERTDREYINSPTELSWILIHTCKCLHSIAFFVVGSTFFNGCSQAEDTDCKESGDDEVNEIPAESTQPEVIPLHSAYYLTVLNLPIKSGEHTAELLKVNSAI